ncbi:MAG TPA: T9SS type A sorting domain-containing protein [Candidatus Kapabacteria bacterium]|nr:T9SS type A sorting domain-containing protein [Candidatus Kapabacteria bacterium]
MKKILILTAFAALAFCSNAAQAQIMLQKAVISSGGASASSNATTQMGSTAGQPVVGVASNSQMRAEFGFWIPSAAPSAVGAGAPAMTLGLQAWPNPASDGTKLTLTIGSASDLDLRLFDITGKQVRSIFSGPASGTLNLDLDVSGLPAGSYILAARIPGQLVEKRISVFR